MAHSDVPYDLAVVGAGAVGTWTATLAREAHPDWRIVLLERGVVADGVTRQSLGVRLPLGRTDNQRRLQKASDAAFAKWAPHVGRDERQLRLVVAVSSANWGALKELLTCDTVLTKVDLQALATPWLPRLREVELLGGLTAFHGDARGITKQLAQRFARADRGQVWEGAELSGYEQIGDRVRLQLTDGRILVTSRLVLATGPWLVHAIGRELAVRAGIKVKRIVALHLDLNAEECDPLIFFFDDDAFLLPDLTAGRWLFSFTRQVWDDDPTQGPRTLLRDDRAAGLDVLARYAPDLLDRCVGGRICCDAYAPDWSPQLIVDAQYERIIALTGCSGSGWRLAPGLAQDALDHFAHFAS